MPRGIGLPPRRLFDLPMIQNPQRGGLTTSLALTALLAFSMLASPAHAANPPALSAKDLAAHLSTLQQDGSSHIRLKFVIKSASENKVLQLQILQRRTKESTEVIYQILWPKERQGESVLLKKSGSQAPAGTQFVPPDKLSTLGPSAMKFPLFNSDLALADLIENFYTWENQSLQGEEMIGKVNCQILESTPGKSQSSIYSRVRSWVDPERLVPLRVEKHLSTGGGIRRIETTLVTKNDNGQNIPANLLIEGPRGDSSTEVEGSRLNTQVVFDDKDFTPEALEEIKKLKSSPAEKP
jgi:hypothetical protein